MIEKNIDCRKHRKSTHLASADLDALTVEKKSLIFTIEDVWYETGVDVSGNKTDGYFCKFKEHKKHMLLNTTNRNMIASFCKSNGIVGEEIYNIGNWKGIVIEMYVNRSVKMMGKIVDGMRIRTVQPIVELPIIADFDKVKEAVSTGNLTIEKLLTLNKVTDKQLKELKS